MKIVNTYSPFIATANNTNGQLFAVLTQDDCGQFAVYVGIVKIIFTAIERQQAENWVAHHGTKQSYRHAIKYFDIAEENYRK